MPEDLLYDVLVLCDFAREWDVNEKAKWAEKLEEKVGYRRTINGIKQRDAEVRQAAKAAIMVRLPGYRV